MELSKQRANSVVDYLVSNGLSESRLKAEDVDPFAPVTTNESEKGKKQVIL